MHHSINLSAMESVSISVAEFKHPAISGH
ncbi:Protein of unknown function [Pyronema omphalodes CBS 100304]|uniref:Uncharacterized protein n=1 Tax=Pyronema omphalodes (strain CBS 100304) TaxID=1076935 RepID=U4KUQ8_PYROM|nr:Protein of unknown function [Pyronema omphalodes CBS 100304]